MSLFDTADKMSSAAMDRVFADPVVWRPMAHRAGSRFTTKLDSPSSYPDPTRPARGVDQAEDPFVAVVVWRPTVIDPGTSQNEQSGVGAGDVMLEFSVDLFADPETGHVELPRKGDRFDIPASDGSMVTVILPRETTDDGTARVQAWCNAPE